MGEPEMLNAKPEPGLETVDWFAARLNIPISTAYEYLRREPERFGAIRLGRKVMVRKAPIEALIHGAR